MAINGDPGIRTCRHSHGPESKRMHADANRSHSIPGFQWETMLETKIGNRQKTLTVQAFTRSVPAKAGIHRLTQGVMNPETRV